MSQSPQPREEKGGGGPPKTDGLPSKRARLRDKKITLTLTLPQATFGLFFALFILVWVFIFGVMLGRGHNPEEVVPQLTEIMPPRHSPAEEPGEEPITEVISPRDLKYHDSLKSKDSATVPRPTVPQPTDRPQALPAPGKAPAPPAVKPGPGVTQTARGQDTFNYVYQVAAFNNTAGAQALQKKLQDDGLNARVTQSKSNGTTWYRILVSFKGTPDDTSVLREKLAKHRISAIILREKTSVN